MDRDDKYCTIGEFVHHHRPRKVDLSVEQADIVRSEALQIAADEDVSVRFKRRYKSGPRNGKTAVQLPVWVWDKAFLNTKI